MNSSSRDMYNHEQMKIFVERFKRKKNNMECLGIYYIYV